jgi:hypothetical protein
VYKVVFLPQITQALIVLMLGTFKKKTKKQVKITPVSKKYLRELKVSHLLLKCREFRRKPLNLLLVLVVRRESLPPRSLPTS